MDSENSGSMYSSSTGGGAEAHDQEFDCTSLFFTTSHNPLIEPSLDHRHNHHHHQPPPSPSLSIIEPVSSSLDLPPPPPQQSITTHLRPSSEIENNNNVVKNNNNPNNIAGTTSRRTMRNKKKRTRASRRAPTTVLTTDTNNFRAMVQEFTGIPEPPFASMTTLPFPLRPNRLDLFGSIGTSITSPYNYNLLKPFAHKSLHQSTRLINTSSNSINYQMLPQGQVLDMNAMQPQGFDFTACLQSPTPNRKNLFLATTNTNETPLETGNVLRDQEFGLSDHDHDDHHDHVLDTTTSILGFNGEVWSPAAPTLKMTDNNGLPSNWSDYDDGVVGSINGVSVSSSSGHIF